VLVEFILSVGVGVGIRLHYLAINLPIRIIVRLLLIFLFVLLRCKEFGLSFLLSIERRRLRLLDILINDYFNYLHFLVLLTGG